MSSAPLSYLNLAQRLGLNADQFRKIIYQALCDARFAIPCIVQSFDPVKQTITALPAICDKMNVPTNGVPVATDVPVMQPFTDLPICIPRAGNVAITLPVQAGDECLVIFSDMCINSWWQNGGANNAQEFKRRHDLSDGIAILGPWSQPNVLQNYNTQAVEMRTEDGTVKLALGPNGIAITCPNEQITINAANAEIIVQAETIQLIATNPVEIVGSMSITGSLTVGNGITSTTIDGKTFLSHTHTGVSTGSSNSGPVT